MGLLGPMVMGTMRPRPSRQVRQNRSEDHVSSFRFKFELQRFCRLRTGFDMDSDLQCTCTDRPGGTRLWLFRVESRGGLSWPAGEACCKAHDTEEPRRSGRGLPWGARPSVTAALSPSMATRPTPIPNQGSEPLLPVHSQILNAAFARIEPSLFSLRSPPRTALPGSAGLPIASGRCPGPSGAVTQH